MKYQVGDKVLIKSWEYLVDSDYTDAGTEMADGWSNCIVTISEVVEEPSFYGEGYYLIEEDSKEWFWYEDLIKYLIFSPHQEIYNSGDRVLIISDLESAYGAVKPMEEWNQKGVTIANYRKDPIFGYVYKIKEDNERWNWFPHMFDHLIKLNINITTPDLMEFLK